MRNDIVLLVHGPNACKFGKMLYLAIGTLSTGRHLNICICFQSLQILITHELSHGHLSSIGYQCELEQAQVFLW